MKGRRRDAEKRERDVEGKRERGGGVERWRERERGGGEEREREVEGKREEDRKSVV